MENEDSNAVKIAVRERPFREEYNKRGQSMIYYPIEGGKTLIVSERPYTLDYVFRPKVPQKEIYDTIVKPLVEKALNGFNCTALAYGQTGTGKSHTMGLDFVNFDDEDTGVIPRCLQELFTRNKENECIEENSQMSTEISISFIEIYNERVYDLLVENYNEPILAKGCKFNGSTKKHLKDIEQCNELVQNANKNRHVRPTKMNSKSSRSHAIFTIHLQIKKNSNEMLASCLNFVDLAGSEGVKRTGHQGLAMSEGVCINQGLLSIGKVIQAMTTGSKVIPYRDSVLSTVLQDSLNLNSYLTLLACISPHREDLSETLSTLRFAQNAKQIKHNPQINNVLIELKRQKSMSKLSYLALKGNQAGKTFKRPMSAVNMNENQQPEDKHSNTFSTPNKKKRAAEFNRFNNSEMGLTPKEKQKAASSRMGSSQVFLFDDNSLGSRSSVVSSPVELQTAKPTSFSPIVRKCFAEFEPRFEAKITEIMSKLIGNKTQNFLQTPINQISQDTPISESDDSPIISSNIIKHSKNKYKLFATSSPVQDPSEDDPKEKEISSTSQEFLQELPVFASQAKSSIRTTRRSQRISLSIPNPDSTINNFEKSKKHNQNSDKIKHQPRRSTRIFERSARMSIMDNSNMNGNHQLSTNKRNVMRQTSHVKTSEGTKESKGRKSKKMSPVSDMIASYMLNNDNKHLSKKDKENNLTKHRNFIMDLLNKGSLRQLQILPQIGQKTAFQIITHRNLNGKFKNLKQVENLPVWRGKTWEKFVKANMLMD